MGNGKTLSGGQLDKARSVVDRLCAAGATDCLLVGGFVRDWLLDIESKDIDIEVYGLGYDRIVEALAPHYHVGLVGRSFGVVKVDNEIDVSIPRRESKTGVGHTDFTVWTLLCHDFGKISTTVRNECGRWIAPEHAASGTPMAREFLESMRAPEWLVERVLPLVSEHMAMLGHPTSDVPSARVIRRLATRLAPANIRLWAAVAEADSNGRPPRPKHNPVTAWVDAADRLALKDNKPQPLLLGRHLLPLGHPPGPDLGTILKAAFEAQLDGAFQDSSEGIAWVQAHFPREKQPCERTRTSGSQP